MRIGLVRGLVALLLLPGISHALGLGDVHLNSPLNAPLDAEIELVNATPEDLATLDAKLATKDTFARYGLDWPPFMASVKVTRDRAANGAQVLRIQSTETVTEPFLTLLIEATWARGRLVREYTVLLDPPVFAPNSVAAAPVPAPRGPTEPGRRTDFTPRAGTGRPQRHAAGAGRWWRQLRSSAWRQPLGHRAPPVRQQRAAHRPAHGVYLPRQFRRVRRRHEPAARRLRVAHPGRRRSRGGIAVGSARRNPSQRRLVCGLAGSSGAGRLRLVPPSRVGRPAQAPVPTIPPKFRNCRAAYATSKASSTNPSACSSCAIPSSPICRPSWQLLSRRLPHNRPRHRAPAETPAATPEPGAPAAPEAAAPEAAAPEAVEPDPRACGRACRDTARGSRPAPSADETASEEPSLLDSILQYWWAVLGRGGAVDRAAVRRSRAANARSPSSTTGWVAWPSRAKTGWPSPMDSLSDTGRMRAPVWRSTVPDDILVEESGTHRALQETQDIPLAPTVRTDETISSETAINLDQGDPLAEADFHMAYGLYDQAADLVRIAIQREPHRRDLKLKLLEVFFVWGNREQFLLDGARAFRYTRRHRAGRVGKDRHHGQADRARGPDVRRWWRGGGAVGVDLNLEGGGAGRVDFDPFDVELAPGCHRRRQRRSGGSRSRQRAARSGCHG